MLNVTPETELLEVDSHDQNKWNAGVGIESDVSYDPSEPIDTHLKNIQSIVKAYGLTVMGSGMIGPGTSEAAGEIRVALPGVSDDRYGLFVYGWRNSVTYNGANDVINGALEVFKYFLGRENGETLWKIIDNKYTGANVALSEYGVTDNGAKGELIGDFVFPDGSTVTYDVTDASRQRVFYFN